MPPLVTASDVTAAEWDAFVTAHPDATGYHPWAWRGIFEQTFGHKTHYLAAKDGNALVGVLPLVSFRSRLFGRYLVSLPFVNYGGVVTSDPAAGEALLEHATSLSRTLGAAHVELRHLTPRFPLLPSRTHKVAMWRSLPGTVELAWQELDRKIRNQVRKAEKGGLSVTTGGAELVDKFYRVFAENMRDLGTPVYSRAFFVRVLQALADRATCVVVISGDAPVAAAIMLRWRDSMEVPWASSLRTARTTSANTLLYWHLLQRAIQARCSIFDFGRSSPDSGTYDFKRQWGASPHPMCWEYAISPGHDVPSLATSNPKFAPAIAVWKRLPVFVTTAVGPHIVRSIP